MAMVMKVEPGGTVYNLPPDLEIPVLEQQIAKAMSDGVAMVVTVDMKDDPTVPSRVVLNGRTLTSVLLFDLAAGPGQEPILDLAG